MKASKSRSQHLGHSRRAGLDDEGEGTDRDQGANPGVTETAAQVIAHHLARLEAAEEGSVRGDDVESVHDMRVAGRSLRVALRVFSEAVEPQDLQEVAEGVGWLAGLLGDVRDFDVSLEWLERYRDSAPAQDRDPISEFVAETEARRDGARVVLVEGLRSERYARLKQGLSALVQQMQGGTAADADLSSYSAAAIREQYRRARVARRQARSGEIEDLHRLRIRCKRLRYTCEFFADSYRGLRPVIKASAAVQNGLGRARDAHLLRKEVREPFRQASGNRRRALRRMRRQLRQEEGAQLRAYRAAAPRLLGRRAGKRLERILALGEAGSAQTR